MLGKFNYIPIFLKKVVVTQRVEYIKRYEETRDAVDQKVSEWLVQAGFLPIPISNKLAVIRNAKNTQANEKPMLQNWLSAIKPNALLLSGGNDIGEYPCRDKTEKLLLNWAQKNKIPLLGICRGMQMMAVWAGGKLGRVINHIGTRHQLNINQSTEKWPSKVNSYHGWGLINCPQNFEVMAHSDDSVIEAIKHKHLPWEGWMWHPERDSPFGEVEIKRLNDLFKGKD